jgi:hypothetical protein
MEENDLVQQTLWWLEQTCDDGPHEVAVADGIASVVWAEPLDLKAGLAAIREKLDAKKG